MGAVGTEVAAESYSFFFSLQADCLWPDLPPRNSSLHWVPGGIIDPRALYSLAADAILISHVLFVAFLVVGLLLV